MRNRGYGALAAGLLGLVGALAAPALAGPPLICFAPYHGSATSLPWENGAPAKGFDRAKLASTTVKLLREQPSALARMETIRRATLYSTDDARLAESVRAAVQHAVLEIEGAKDATKEARAHAWFDAGYLAACYGQLGIGTPEARSEKGTPGVAWIDKALSLTPEDAEMRFGAALAKLDSEGSQKEDFRKAVAGAAKNPELTRSIESHAAFGGRPVAEWRKELGLPDAVTSGRQ
jgi:hypothetical protein